MLRPAGWRRLPEDVLDIKPRTAFDQEPHDFTMTSQGGLVQRGRVRMTWAISVGILACVEQQSDDFGMSKLCCQGKRELTSLAICGCKQPAGILGSSQRCRYGQIDTRATGNQSVHGLVLTLQGCSMYSGIGIRSAIAKEID